MNKSPSEEPEALRHLRTAALVFGRGHTGQTTNGPGRGREESMSHSYILRVFPNILKSTAVALLLCGDRMTSLPAPLQLCPVGTQDTPGKTENYITRRATSDPIRLIAFSILPRAALYGDLWIVISSFTQTNPQKVSIVFFKSLQRGYCLTMVLRLRAKGM